MFVAFVIQYVKRVRHIMLSSVARLAVPYFFHIISQTVRFSENMLLNIKCVFWFSLQIFFEAFLILRRIQRDVINVKTPSCKVPIILVRFSRNFISSTDFRKTLKYQKFIEIRSVWAELFHVAQARTDKHDKADSHFSQFLRLDSDLV